MLWQIMFLTAFLGLSCSESSFVSDSGDLGGKKGSSKSDTPQESDGSTSGETDDEEDGLDENDDESSDEDIDLGADVDQGTFKKCTQKLDYDPLQIECSLAPGSSTIWDQTVPWQGLVENFKDKSSRWISPLAQSSVGSHSICPEVPNAEKLIYVSHFRLEKSAALKVEAIIDDIGTVNIWQNADPKMEVYKSNRASTANSSFSFKKGFYSVVVEAEDTGKVATGMILSIKKEDGTVVKNTGDRSGWCIFRVAGNTKVSEFLLKAASCQECFVGVKE